MARGVVPFWGGEQTEGVISPDPHPSRSNPEQDPAHVLRPDGCGQQRSERRAALVRKPPVLVFRGDLATKVKSGREGASGKVRVREAPGGAAGRRGPQAVLPTAAKAGSSGVSC